MSADRRRPEDWGALLAAWPAAEPRPGFADRVLAACDAPAPPRLAVVRPPPASPSAARALLVFAAVAAALVLIPFVVHRRAAPHPPSVAAAGTVFDLGLEHD